MKNKKCPICNNKETKKGFEFFSPPKMETDFKIKKYYRFYFICKKCKHHFQNKNLLPQNIYTSEYDKYAYKKKITNTFKKIIKLKKDKSDNYHRINRIKKFSKDSFKLSKINLLDIGSGLGVFPFFIKKLGWTPTSIEPNTTFANHLKKILNLNCINTDYLKKKISNTYEIVSLNKVLEHVKSPLKMLKKTKENLKRNGFVYVEVPDGASAFKYGKDREEFTVDHLHVFSMKSLQILCKKSGYIVKKIKKIREKSGKLTIFAFLKLS